MYQKFYNHSLSEAEMDDDFFHSIEAEIFNMNKTLTGQFDLLDETLSAIMELRTTLDDKDISTDLSPFTNSIEI